MHNDQDYSIKRFLSAKELAIFLSLSVRTIEKHSNKIVGRVKIGRSVRYDVKEVLKQLNLRDSIYYKGAEE